MYKFGDNQISFSDFGQPVGMKMSPNNRWVKKAESIPWREIELKYAKLFQNRKGNVAKPLRLALGACIIQAEYGYSDEETTLQIQEGPYLQFFCGFPKYKDEPSFDPSLMVHFRKRLTPEILGEINELIVKRAKENKSKNDSDSTPSSGGNAQAVTETAPVTVAQDSQTTSSAGKAETVAEQKAENKGTLIVDATCAPSNIRYPRDSDLLNQAREFTEEVIDVLHEQNKELEKPRTYRKQARKDYLSLARSKRPGAKKIHNAIKKQLSYLARNIESIRVLLEQGCSLSEKMRQRFGTVAALYTQQHYMFTNQVHSVENRIVSLQQPFLRPIVRGKANAPVEFGAKLDISIADGWAYLEKTSFDAYNEAMFLKQTIENYFKRTGHYPVRVLADKIYRNRDNIKFCKEHQIRLSGPALGRPKKNEIRDKKQDYRDEADRVEVERSFSLAKRKCGLGMIVTKLESTVCHSIAMSILVLNLRKALKCRPDVRAWLCSSLFRNFQMIIVQ